MPNHLSLSQVHRREARWYRGDFHCHTHHSDGVLPPPDLLKLAQAEGLEFFAITDHNTLDAYSLFGESGDLLILPGIEVTYEEGHFNVFGLADGADWWLARLRAGKPWDKISLGGDFPTMTDVMGATAERGWLNSINHPLLKPWQWREAATDLRRVDCLEIWNDPSWPDNAHDNPAAVRLWTGLLNAGYRITAIGGSDFHRPTAQPGENLPAQRLGLPSTYVYSDELSGAAILRALRARRVMVSMGPQASFGARLDGRELGIGEEAGEAGGKFVLRGEVYGAEREGIARIVKNGEVKLESELEAGGCALEWRDEVREGEQGWYRLEAWDRQGQLLVITNPIFFGARPVPERHHFGDFVSGLK